MTSYRLLIAAAAIACLFAGPIKAAETERQITVQGQGKIAVVPDMVGLTAGVEHRAAKAEQVMAAVTKDLARLIALLKTSGIAARDIRTGDIYITPVYPKSRSSAAGVARQPLEYRAGGNLRIRVREIDRTGMLLDQLFAAGVNRLSGLSFAVADPEPLLAEARRDAIRDARERAALYAAEAGVELGRVLRIDERSPAGPYPEVQSLRAAPMRSDAIAPGEQEIRATVTVTFALR
jgi:uncharacterized protein YggE